MKIKKLYLSACQKLGATVSAPSSRQAQAAMFVFGVSILALGLYKQALAQDEAPEYNDERIGDAFDRVLTYLEGTFGALVMVAAGLGAILSSAFGQYRAALGCLVVAVGTFILRSFISTFFNTTGTTLLGDGA